MPDAHSHDDDADRESRALLAVFAKYPRLGRVKTRLESAYSVRRCLEIHQAFLGDTLERTARLGMGRRLFLADADPRELEEMAQRYPDWPVVRQKGSDLGRRLANAYGHLCETHPLEPHPHVLFIGADSPDMPLELIRRAGQELKRHSTVIVPSRDGGYCLLGLSRPRPELFSAIDWGSENVLRQTIDRSQRDPPLLLPVWNDVDHPQDLIDLARRIDARRDSSEDRLPKTSRILEALGLRRI